MVKTKTEIYSRVVGYIRPVEQWNDTKREEFKDRKYFDKAFESDKSLQDRQTVLK